MKDRRLAKGALVGAALGIATTADAATFNVTNNADAGAGSLRQAVADANTNAGPDSITFAAGLTGSTISLTTGEMLISDTVDIQGPGASSLTINANDASRVFYVYNPSPTPVDVTISGLTITDARSVVPADPVASSGGAIRAMGENLSLDDVHVLNSVAGGDGGGVAFFGIDGLSSYNPVSAVLSIQNSVISGNASDFTDNAQIDQGGCGGGVWAAGVYNVQLDNATLANNTARCDGGGLFGVYFQDGGTVTIANSVITGNQAGAGGSGNGGGIGLLHLGEGYYGTGSASITDTTISGNSAPGYGGGIIVTGVGLTLTRSTVSGNTSGEGSGGVGVSYATGTIENSTIAENSTYGWGGGIYAYYADVTVKETTVSGNTAEQDGPGIYAYAASAVTVLNSIVANNGPGADLVDDSDSFFDVGHSLIENPDVAQINDLGGNLTGVDPQLGPLQNNGGPTFTMKPAFASPAVNAGDPAFTPPPATDQRGFPRVVGGRIDMGAVELNAGTVQFSLASQNVNENAGTAVVTVTRTGGIDGAASVQVSVNGASTATGGGTDYTFAGATVNFADNSSTPQVLNIPITDDGVDEPNETIVLNLGSPAGAAIGTPSTHTVTILDGLNPGTLQFAILSQSFNENGGTATVQVTRTGGDDGPASAQVSVDGSSTATGGGVDHSFASATVNFADGSATPQIVSVPIVDDAVDEPNETVVLTLGSPAGATIGAPSTHTINILDDDLAPPAADVSIVKSRVPGSLIAGDTVTFTLAVSNAGPDPATNVVVTDTLPSQLTFVSAATTAGSCSGSVTVTCNLGNLAPSGTATITIVARMTGVGATTNTAGVTSTTIDNDPADNTSQATFTIAAPANVPIPTLDPRMLLLLASLMAATALGVLTKK